MNELLDSFYYEYGFRTMPGGESKADRELEKEQTSLQSALTRRQYRHVSRLVGAADTKIHQMSRLNFFCRNAAGRAAYDGNLCRRG